MKILHTADWHLGQNFFGSDRTEEHRYFLEWLAAAVRTEHPDVMLIAGDVFDSANPPAVSERLLWNFMDKLTQENPCMRVIMISGNHDGGLRLDAPAALYRRIGVQVRGRLKYDGQGHPDLEDLMIPVNAINDTEDKTVILAVPYLHGDDYEQTQKPMEGMKEWYNELLRVSAKRFEGIPLILVSHFFAVGSSFNTPDSGEYVVVGGENAMDVSEFSPQVAYTALGHIHKAQSVGGKDNIWYCGSALPMSFTEKSYDHGVNLVELNNEGKVTVKRLSYVPLRHMMTIPQEGVADLDEVMKQLSLLPKADKKNGELFPYLQVKVQVLKPDPGMINKIQEEVSKRQVRLCRVERVRPNGERPSDILNMATSDDLKKLSPAKIARDTYKTIYGDDMPDEIAKLMAEVKRACEKDIESEA